MSRSAPHVPYDPRSNVRGTVIAVGHCPDCGKLSYRSRRDAKRAARQQPGQMRAYQHGFWWHLTSADTERTTYFRERG